MSNSLQGPCMKQKKMIEVIFGPKQSMRTRNKFTGKIQLLVADGGYNDVEEVWNVEENNGLWLKRRGSRRKKEIVCGRWPKTRHSLVTEVDDSLRVDLHVA